MLEVPKINLEGFKRECSINDDDAVFFIQHGTSNKIVVKPVQVSGGNEVFLLKSYEGSESHIPPVLKSDRISQDIDELKVDLSEMAGELKSLKKG